MGALVVGGIQEGFFGEIKYDMPTGTNGRNIIYWVVATQIFFIFIPTWGNDPIWLIFLKWVETTN